MTDERCLASLLQQWWLTRWYDDKGANSNIRIGDFFTLARNNQVGIISGKTVICHMKSTEEKIGPGLHLEYTISGDIGGYYYRPLHEDMQYFLFIPSATQLAEISTQLADTKLLDWAQELLVYYRDNPGYLNV